MEAELMIKKKPASMLTVNDFQSWPIWKYTNAHELEFDETIVTPVELLPVADLSGCIIGTKVVLNNNEELWGTLSNIDLFDELQTTHFRTLSIFGAKGEFCLARYFDVDYDTRGPAQLAQILGMSVSDVFPIRYDISKFVNGDALFVKSMFPIEPAIKLSHREIIKLAVK